MSKDGVEAGESVPSPTRTPAARSSASGAMPQPSRAFERGQWATGTSRSASSAISSSSTSTQCAQSRSGPSTGSSVATARLPVGGDEDRRDRLRAARVPCSSHSFSFARLGEVRADRDAEREAPAVDVERAGVRRVRRDADAAPARSPSSCAALRRRSARSATAGSTREDLEVDDRPQAELGRGRRRRAGEAVVGRRRDPGAKRVEHAAAREARASRRASSRLLRAACVRDPRAERLPVAEAGVPEYSRCEWALTMPGRIAASAKWRSARPWETSTIAPSSSRTRPSSIGGPSTGSTQSAETSVIRPRSRSRAASGARRSPESQSEIR